MEVLLLVKRPLGFFSQKINEDKNREAFSGKNEKQMTNWSKYRGKCYF